jgi:hypothetical protein
LGYRHRARRAVRWASTSQTAIKEHAVTDATTAPDTREPSSRPETTARATGDGGRLLASAVSINAIFSSVSGVVLLASVPMLSGPIGVAGWILAAVGVGLVGFAVLLVWLSAAPRRLAVGAPYVLVADVAWVLGAVVLLAGFPELLAPAGRVGLAAVSAVVAAIAVGQAVGLRRRGHGPMTATSPVHLRFERIVAAPVERVWEAISDAGDYGRFAPGIAHTAIVDGEREGMVRVCRDDQGAEWSETCTLWEEGHRYRMSVDVSSYPAHYRMLLHEFAQSWTLEPVPGGTRIQLAFDGAAKLGLLGRGAVRMLGRKGRLEAILDNYERELTGAAQTG